MDVVGGGEGGEDVRWRRARWSWKEDSQVAVRMGSGTEERRDSARSNAWSEGLWGAGAPRALRVGLEALVAREEVGRSEERREAAHPRERGERGVEAKVSRSWKHMSAWARALG